MTTETALPVDDYAATHYPLWQSHKKVRGFKIGEITSTGYDHNKRVLVPEDKSLPPVEVDLIFVRMHLVQVGWYYVIYENNYKAASPPEAFENGYTLLQKPMPLDTQEWTAHDIKGFEDRVMGFRYGHAIVGISLIDDRAYDGFLQLVRSTKNLPADSPVRQPTSNKPEDYSRDAINWFEIIVVGKLREKGFLKQLDKPSFEGFDLAQYLTYEANRIFANTVLTQADYSAIVTRVMTLYPRFAYMSLPDLINPNNFRELKRALEDAIAVHITR